MSGKPIMQTSLWSSHFIPSVPAAAMLRRLSPSPSAWLVFGYSVHLIFRTPVPIVALPSSGRSFSTMLGKGKGKKREEKRKLKGKEGKE